MSDNRVQQNLTTWQYWRNIVYDPSTVKIFGRTASGWKRLLLFYSVFYAVLAVIIAICAAGLMKFLDKKAPRYTLDDSLIGTNPGLAFRPMSENLEDGAIIWYSVNSETSIERWTKLTDEFLKPYMEKKKKNMINCSFKRFPKWKQVCKPNVDMFKDCSKKNSPHYGFDVGSPCIFLKLNRIMYWEPKFFTKPQPKMSSFLNDTIIKTPVKQRFMIWVSCDGENDHDREHLGNFSYNPAGFPAYFYPYTNNDNYLSPLVAVKIQNPKKNVLITIECKAWAENINHLRSADYRGGGVVFQLMIDDVFEKRVETTINHGSLVPETVTDGTLSHNNQSADKSYLVDKSGKDKTTATIAKLLHDKEDIGKIDILPKSGNKTAESGSKIELESLLKSHLKLIDGNESESILKSHLKLVDGNESRQLDPKIEEMGIELDQMISGNAFSVPYSVTDTNPTQKFVSSEEVSKLTNINTTEEAEVKEINDIEKSYIVGSTGAISKQSLGAKKYGELS